MSLAVGGISFDGTPFDLTLRAELYTAPSGNVFTPTGAFCDLAPRLDVASMVGTTAGCEINGLSIPLTAMTKAVFVVSATTTGHNYLQITANFSVSMSTS